MTIACATILLDPPRTGRQIADVVRRIVEKELAKPEGVDTYAMDYVEEAFYFDGDAVKIGQSRASAPHERTQQGEFCARYQVMVRPAGEKTLFFCEQEYREILVVDHRWLPQGRNLSTPSNKQLIDSVKRFAEVLGHELSIADDSRGNIKE